MPVLPYILSVRAAPRVAQQSMVELNQWRLLLTQSEELRLTMALSPGTLRITSPLVAIDLASAVARTWSGRLYRFTRPPEHDEFTRLLLSATAAKGFPTAVDVSDQAWAELSGATKELKIFQARRIKHESTAPDNKVTHSEH